MHNFNYSRSNVWHRGVTTDNFEHFLNIWFGVQALMDYSVKVWLCQKLKEGCFKSRIFLHILSGFYLCNLKGTLVENASR